MKKLIIIFGLLAITALLIGQARIHLIDKPAKIEGFLNVQGNIFPVWDGKYDLGTSTYRWDSLFANNVVFTTLDIDSLDLTLLNADSTNTDHLIVNDNAVFSDTVTAKVGRSATIVVAASNSSDLAKYQADYVCDGTDDQVEIQAAIDAVSVGGRGTVHLMEGTFNVRRLGDPKGAIQMKSNVSLRGSGIRVSIIRVDDDAGTDTAPIGFWGDVTDVEISYLTVDGNKERTGNGGEDEGIDWGNVDSDYPMRIYIHDVIVQNCGDDAMDSDGAYWVWIHNVILQNNTGGGVHFSGDTDSVLIENITTINNGSLSIADGAAIGAYGSNTSVAGWRSYGDYRGGLFGRRNVSIQDFTITFPTEVGIRVDGSDGEQIAIANGIITGVPTSDRAIGIEITAQKITYASNLFTIRNVQLIDLSPSIYIGADVRWVEIDEVNIAYRFGALPDPSYGIDIASTNETSRWAIRNSRIRGPVTCAIRASGSGLISNNYINGSVTNAIRLISGAGNIEVLGNHITSTRMFYLEADGINNIMVVNNNFSMTNFTFSKQPGTGWIVHNNRGYVTENYGTATFDATKTADTLVITGVTASDYYFLQWKGATVPTSPLTYTAAVNSLIVFCAPADTSVARASGYNWLRLQ